MDSLADLWTVDSELGKGAYGTVYLISASQDLSACTSDTAKYALKVLKEIETGESTETDHKEAVRELRIMRGLSHPHVVQLLDSFNLHGQLYLVLELCEGGDLRQYLNEFKNMRLVEQDYLEEETSPLEGLEESLVLRWTQQLASGLTYLHQRRIVHRDIKPQNIFLKDEQTLKIGDMGVAKQMVHTLQQLETFIGTLLYMSPEILQYEGYSFKSDVWGLGCCIYEMMMLDYAFYAKLQYRLIFKVVNEQVKPPAGHYSEFLRSLMLSMLEKNPHDRPSAHDILKSLQEYDAVSSHPPCKENGVAENESTQHLQPQDDKTSWRLNIARAVVDFQSKANVRKIAQIEGAMKKHLERSKINSDSIKSLTGSEKETVIVKSQRRRQQRKLRGEARNPESQKGQDDVFDNARRAPSDNKAGFADTDQTDFMASGYDRQRIIANMEALCTDETSTLTPNNKNNGASSSDNPEADFLVPFISVNSKLERQNHPGKSDPEFENQLEDHVGTSSRPEKRVGDNRHVGGNSRIGKQKQSKAPRYKQPSANAAPSQPLPSQSDPQRREPRKPRPLPIPKALQKLDADKKFNHLTSLHSSDQPDDGDNSRDTRTNGTSSSSSRDYFVRHHHKPVTEFDAMDKPSVRDLSKVKSQDIADARKSVDDQDVSSRTPQPQYPNHHDHNQSSADNESDSQVDKSTSHYDFGEDTDTKKFGAAKTKRQKNRLKASSDLAKESHNGVAFAKASPDLAEESRNGVAIGLTKASPDLAEESRNGVAVGLTKANSDLVEESCDGVAFGRTHGQRQGETIIEVKTTKATKEDAESDTEEESIQLFYRSGGKVVFRK